MFSNKHLYDVYCSFSSFFIYMCMYTWLISYRIILFENINPAKFFRFWPIPRSSEVIRTGNYTRVFAQVAKWVESPEWLKCNVYQPRHNIVIVFRYVSDHFKHVSQNKKFLLWSNICAINFIPASDLKCLVTGDLNTPTFGFMPNILPFELPGRYFVFHLLEHCYEIYVYIQYVSITTNVLHKMYFTWKALP